MTWKPYVKMKQTAETTLPFFFQIIKTLMKAENVYIYILEQLIKHAPQKYTVVPKPAYKNCKYFINIITIHNKNSLLRD